jgi:hypothetical protein
MSDLSYEALALQQIAQRDGWEALAKQVVPRYDAKIDPPPHTVLCGKFLLRAHRRPRIVEINVDTTAIFPLALTAYDARQLGNALNAQADMAERKDV